MGYLIVICALGLCLAIVVAAVVAVWRARATADARVAEAVRKLALGMHDTMRDLAESLEANAPEAGRALTEGEGYKGELAASLDLQEVAERTLEALRAIPGVEAASLEASELVASAGLGPDEGAGAAVGLPDNDNLRAVELGYRYRIEGSDSSASLIRSGVVVPLRADGGSIGALSAFTRAADRPFSDEEIDEIERLAVRAGPAVANARRYTEARALADLDALTGLHNRRYFHEALAREATRAERYSRRLALIVIDLDDFKSINDRVGHLTGDAVLAEAAARMLSVVRGADIACRVGGDEFAIVLPEAGSEDAELLAGRVAHAVSMRPIANAGTLLLSAGVAELREGDRPEQLFERADAALYRAKESGKARTVLADGAS
ncbi:MAG: sensor domain-containing diguanylate cyclase [Actinobacteria bacterium]|nr:sensor domain-containing diguanylate cyclase [Actinomycetota bacterium]